MDIASDVPKRPALRYYGGKWNLAPWIISHFPKHLNYVEPCGGAASVLLQKQRSPLETYNDLDGNVVNFFRVLRDQPEELIRKIGLTPWAREEYQLSKQGCSDPVEAARRFFMGNILSISGNPRASGLRVCKNHADARDRVTTVLDELYVIANRLLSTPESMVQIENDSYQRMISRFDGSDTLIYFDPPYVLSERTSKKEYVFEWIDQQHTEAANLLRKAKGYVVVSGYACPLYTDLYESHGWNRVDREAQTNSGGKRIESLWLSPRTWSALQNDVSDMPLFSMRN